jgi:hypothetical protein
VICKTCWFIFKKSKCFLGWDLEHGQIKQLAKITKNCKLHEKRAESRKVSL